ncbi:MAG: hypothetical protein ACOX5R_17425 [bacterium]|jgi:hypothetical protein
MLNHIREKIVSESFKTKLKTWFSRFRSISKGNAFLCDSCKWNYGNICNRPEKPNALKCPDYTSK